MSLFPFFTEDEDDELLDTVNEENLQPYREYEIDPETGKLTGRIVEGTDAILTWVLLTLRSERYKHVIYSWDYGEEFSTMIGNSYAPDLLQSEGKRMVEEALLVNEHILSIVNLVIEQISDELHIIFSLETDQGDISGVSMYV